MNEKGNRYALAALKERRALLASEIISLERQLKHRKQLIVHVDQTLRLLDPSIDPKTIKNKRPTRRIKLFRHGELGRMILGALRNANGGPLSTHQIVDGIIADGEHGEGARTALTPRVRGNLQYLLRRGLVTKSEDGRAARWMVS